MQAPRCGANLTTVACAGERMVEVLRELDRLMTQRQEQPAVLQTDRGPCFIGAEGGSRTAVPGRLTLWLWGLGIAHHILPPAKPWRNGAVERFHGALEQSWQGEIDGLSALQAVWNVGKHGGTPGQPYVGRRGFQLAKVWQGLATVQVRRSVDAQGKLSLWDRPLRVGIAWADRSVVVSFDATRQRVIVHDKHDRLIAERVLAWLTADWIWNVSDGVTAPPVPAGAAQAMDSGGTTILQ